VGGPSWQPLWVTASGGGRVELPELEQVPGGQVNVSVDGEGSTADLSNSTLLTIAGGASIQFTAKGGGKVDLRQVESIVGGACALLAEGAGSVIDLSRLSSFATLLGESSLVARDGGVILLGSDAFLLVNVRVEVAGNAILPPVISATGAVSLYGRAWHGYWVDVRDTRIPDSPWQFYRRVPLTQDLEVIGGTPFPWQAFRVREFVAAPPLLDLEETESGALRLVLYGEVGRTFHIEATPHIDLPLIPWETSTTVGDMTNTFRILPAFPVGTGNRFHRAWHP